MEQRKDLPPGNVELRRLIALRYAEAGVDIAPEDIVITCGAMEAINLSLNAVAKPGDIIAIRVANLLLVSALD